MRILLLADTLSTVDGVTTHLYNLIKGLSAYRDIDLFLICGKNITNKLNGLNINIQCNEIFLHGKRNYFDYLKAFRYLRKFIKENKINILHSHTHYAANIANQVSGGISTIQTNHGLLVKQGRLKHFCADKYIAVNKHIYEYLLQNKIADQKNIHLIRCGIEMPDEIINKQNGKIKVLAASRLTHEKGLDIFIKAAAGLSVVDKSKAEFYIAGEGEEEQSLKILNEKLNSNITFTGKVENMKELFTESHIFVFSGRSDTEGFPASITEAAAYKNLILSANFSGADDVIKDKKDGFIFKKEDNAALSALLSEAIKNYIHYIPIAENFNKKVREMYNLKIMINKHYNLYKECQAE